MTQDLNDALRKEGPSAICGKLDGIWAATRKGNGHLNERGHRGRVVNPNDRRLKANRSEAETPKSPHVNVYDFPDDDSFSIRLADSGVVGRAARARAEEFDPRFKFTSAADLAYVLDDIFLVDDLLPSEGLAAFYGPPGCGKSFGAIDLAVCLGVGIPYAGKHTEQAYVIYVAAEGGKLFDNRVKAAISQRDIKQKDVAIEVVHAAPNLGRGDKDAKALIQAIKAQRNPAFAHLPLVVVVDTLARTMGGAPENDEGIGAFITNCGLIEKEFGGLVIAVHHTGKDPEKGLRGHSSLHGATDCEWFFSETDNGRSIQLAKFKDADDDLAWDFTLKQVEVGRSKKRGKPVTTCIVNIANDPAKTENVKVSVKTKKQQLKGQKAEFLKAVKWAINEKGEIMPGAGCQPLNTKGVRRDDLKRYVLQKGFFDNCKPEAQRASLNKMILVKLPATGSCIKTRNGCGCLDEKVQPQGGSCGDKKVQP